MTTCSLEVHYADRCSGQSLPLEWHALHPCSLAVTPLVGCADANATGTSLSRSMAPLTYYVVYRQRVPAIHMDVVSWYTLALYLQYMYSVVWQGRATLHQLASSQRGMRFLVKADQVPLTRWHASVGVVMAVPCYMVWC